MINFNKILVLAPVIGTLYLGACDNKETGFNPVEVIPDVVPDHEVIQIPVVVHVLDYAPDPIEISNEKILSQIDALNKDFRKKNEDWKKTPDEFADRVADVGIEFILAETDPNGHPTSGIIRTSGTVTGWDGNNVSEKPIEELALYFTAKGGQDIWPADHYLNIWIADLSDRSGRLGLAGFANLPGCDPRIDGVVIDPRVFGTLPPLQQNNELGRTATHEIGHWLNLRHIYGAEGSCDEGDLVDDTPDQLSQYLGSPTYPVASCGSNDMFMNFMDRVDDQSMYMFTEGQKARMRALFNSGGLRRDLYLNSRK